MTERGSGLLDAIAATAIGLLVAHAASDTVAAVRSLAATGERDRRLVTARNLLEHALAVPCAPAAACPSDMNCAVSTEQLAGGTPALVRVRVSVSPAGDSATAVTLVGVRSEACA